MVKLGYSNYYWLKQDRIDRQREKHHVHETRSITLSDRVQSETSDDQSREGQFQGVRRDDGDQRRDVQRSESGMRDRRELNRHIDKGSGRPSEESRLLPHGKVPKDDVPKHDSDLQGWRRVRDERTTDDKRSEKTGDIESDI